MFESNDSTIKAAIVAAMLDNVVFYGWAETALTEAGRDHGLDELERERLFPNGVADAVAAFIANADRKMEVALPAEELAALRVHERIERLILTRLAQYDGRREVVRATLAYYALPPHLLTGLQTLYRTVNTMWYLAGDTSSDFSYYTRRATLASVYSSTLLCWLDDSSEGEADTQAFLKRRLKDVLRINKARRRLDEVLARGRYLLPGKCRP